MKSLTNLEARANAAAQSLAGHREYERDLEQALGRLESEMQELRGHGERLGSDMSELREQNERLTSEGERLHEENRQLAGNDKQAQATVVRLEEEIENVLQEHDKLSAILEALMTQIELNLEATATEVEDSAEAEQSVATTDVADDTTGMANSDDEIGSDVEAIVATLGDEYSGDEIEEFPEDGAKKMVDRISSFVDEEAKASAGKGRSLVDRIRRRA